MINSKVSYTSSCKGYERDNIFIYDLVEIIDKIKFDNELKKKIDKIRNEKDKNKRRVLKQETLPVVCFQGEFNKINKKGLIKHNGLAVIDIDDYNNKNITKLKEKIKQNNHVVFIFESPSGGLKVGCRIPEVKNDEEYKDYYLGLYEFYKKYSKEVDKATTDISRLCYLSYDPEIYFNSDAKVFNQKIKKDKIIKTNDVNIQNVSDEDIENALNFIDSDDREVWFKICCSLKSYNEKAFSLFDKWSSKSKNYQGTEDCRRTWDSLKRKDIEETINIGTLFYMAKQNGYVKKTNIDNDLWEVLSFEFLEQFPCYYDSSKILYGYDISENVWNITDETDIVNIAKNILKKGGLNSRGSRSSFLNAILDRARWNKPKEVEKSWLHFEDCFYDFQKNKKYEPSKEYFSLIKIPHKLGLSTDTPIIDQKIKSWVGESQYKLFVQICAYSMFKSYPFARFFIFYGTGQDGKSTAGKFITNLIGEKNTCTVDIDLLSTNRFEAQKMYQKTFSICGEVDYKLLKNTRKLKGVTGEDPITIEFKNKNPFQYYNFAKLLWFANGIPPTYDKTQGFYRRTVILKFPNKFEECYNPLGDIPEYEYENFCFKCCNVLLDLLISGFDEKTIEEKEKEYEELSNPVMKFFEENYYETGKDDDFLIVGDVYKEYEKYAKKYGYRSFNYKDFYSMMGNLENVTIENKNVYFIEETEEISLKKIEFMTFETTRTKKSIIKSFKPKT